MSKVIASSVKTVMALGLAAGLATAVALPAQAGDGGAIAAGIIGGTALGVLVGATVAHPPPPPPYYYYPPAPAYYAPPHCWHEPRQVWDGYEWVVRRVRICQ